MTGESRTALRKNWKRIVSVFLSVFLVLGGIDPSGIAGLRVLAASQSRTVIQPLELEEEIRTQFLPLRASASDAVFPVSIQASVVGKTTGKKVASGSSAFRDDIISAAVDEDDGELLDGIVMNDLGTGTDEDDILISTASSARSTASDAEDSIIQVPVQRWKLNPEKSSESSFRSDLPGLSFVYVPEISSNYVLEKGEELPEIMLVITDSDAKLLPVVPLTEMQLEEGASCVGIGNEPEHLLPEEGKYIVTLLRGGNLDTETVVRLNTLDIAAHYGEDYVIEDARYETAANPIASETYMEQNGREAEKKAREILETGDSVAMEVLQEASGETDGADAAPGDPDDPERDEEEAEEMAEEEESDTPGSASEDGENIGTATPGDAAKTHSLAALKRAQTGHATRETYESEMDANIGKLAEDLLGFDGEQSADLEPSSVTEIRFAPGEKQKQVIFRILEDEKPEDREDFRLALTADEDGAVIHETMNYISVLIEADEKAETPSVSFAARTIKADALNAYIALERKGTEYTVLEGSVRTKDGTAKAGTNYAETSMEFMMIPYQNLAVVVIPVTGEKEDLSFEVELFDLKSAKAGAVTTATVVIPKTYDTPALVRDRTRLAPQVFAASGNVPAGQESSYTIGGKDCKIVWQSGENYGLIYDPDYAKDVVMGRVYKPVKITGEGSSTGKKYEESTWNHFGDYGKMSSASAKLEGKYNRWNIYYRSMWWWDRGGTQVLYNIETGRWQSVFFDSESLCNLDGAVNGISIELTDAKKGRNVADNNRSWREASYRKKKSRGLYDNALRLLYVKDSGVVSGTDTKSIPEYPIPSMSEVQPLRIFTKKDGGGLGTPEMNVYSLVLLNREFRVQVQDPEPLEFRRAGSANKVKEAPARVWIDSEVGDGSGKKYYMGQSIEFKVDPVFNSTITDPEGQTGDVNGILDKYIITCGDGGTIEVPNSASNSIELTEELVQKIDKLTKKVNTTKKGYYTVLKIRPHFKPRPVVLEILPASEGYFKNADLSLGEQGTQAKTVTGYNMGDQIDLAAVPKSGYENFVYDSFQKEGFVNYGDTGGVRPENVLARGNDTVTPMMLKYSKYRLAPVFSVSDNVIEVRMTEAAKKYFTLQGMITAAEIDKEVREGRLKLSGRQLKEMKDANILKIDDAPAGTPATRPVTGRAYTLSVLPTASNGEGKYRPVWKMEKRGETVQGDTLDLLADPRKDRNVILLDAEEVDPAKYVQYSVSGTLCYSSYSLRSSGQDLHSEPVYSANIQAGPTYARGLRPGSTSAADGSFEANGIRAMHGDRISVLIQNNGAQTVKYVTLSGKNAGTVKKTVERIVSGSDGTAAVRKEELECFQVRFSDPKVNEKAKADCIFMPVWTDYQPHLVSVEYSFGNHQEDTRSSAIPLLSDDTLTLKFKVFNPEKVRTTGVIFRIYDRKGTQRGAGEYETKFNQGAGTWDGTLSLQPDFVQPGDRIVAIVKSDEKITMSNGATINWVSSPVYTGLSFYERNERPKTFDFYLEPNFTFTEAPVLGPMGPKVDAGTIVIAERRYDNPSDYRSPYYLVYAGGLQRTKKSRGDWKAFSDVYWGADSDASMNHEKQVAADVEALKVNGNLSHERVKNVVNDQEKRFLEDQLADINDEGEKKQFKKEWDEAQVKEYKKQQKAKHKKDSIETLQAKEDASRWGFTFQLVLQYRFVFDPKANNGLGEHIYWGCTGFIMGLGDYEITKYGSIYGFPVFFDITASGGGSVTWRTKSNERKTYEELNKVANLATVDAAKMDTYFTIMFSDVLISLGAGINKKLDIRGGIGIQAMATWNCNKRPYPGSTKSWGAMASIRGEANIDLCITKFKFVTDPVCATWGFYNPDNSASYKPSPGSAKNDELKLSLEADRRGGSGADEWLLPNMQNSTFDQIAKYTLDEDTLEYIRPSAKFLGDDIVMLTFLRSDPERESAANSSKLYYALGYFGTEGTDFSVMQPVPVDSGSRTMDSYPSVLKIGDKVFVAYVSADEELNIDETNVKEVADALGKTNIWLREYRYNSTGRVDENTLTPVGQPKKVTDVPYACTDVELREEDGKAVIYYYMEDYSKVSETGEISSLISQTENYFTVCRSVYDPEAAPTASASDADDTGAGETGAFVPYVDASGREWSTEFIELPHPSIQDPMVDDYTVGSYSYGEGDDAQKYRFEAWTVDTDKNINTGTDRELWVRVTNLSSGRQYYPVKLCTDPEYGVRDPLLSETIDGDLLLTFLTGNSDFHTYSAKRMFRSLNWNQEAGGEGDAEETGGEATLDRIRGLKNPDMRGWYEGFSNFDRALCPVVTDFSGKSGGMTDYQIVSGADENIYLFWSGRGIESLTSQELYGACLYADRDEDGRIKAKTEYDDPSFGWGPAVQLTHDGNVIDEKDIVVNSDSQMMVLANTYSMEFSDDGKEGFTYGPNDLVAYLFNEVSTLQLYDIDLYLDDPNPVPGEPFTLYADVTNPGMMPNDSCEFTLTLKKDGNVVDTVNEQFMSDEGGYIFMGQTKTFSFTGDWADSGKVDTIEVSVTGQRDGVTIPGWTDYGKINEDEEFASYYLETGPALEVGDAYWMDAFDAQEQIFLTGDTLEKDMKGLDSKEVEEEYGTNDMWTDQANEYLALLRLKELCSEDPEELSGTNGYFAAVVPVTNTGTKTLNELNVRAVAQKLDEFGRASDGHVLGEAKISDLALEPGMNKYVAVALRPDEEDYDEFMGMEVRFYLTSSEFDESRQYEESEDEAPKERKYTAMAYVQPLENYYLELNGGQKTEMLSWGESFKLKPEVYPWKDAANVFYYSENPEVASVTEDGVVHAEGNGTTYICAVDSTDHILEENIKVTVTGAPEEDDGNPDDGGKPDRRGGSGGSGSSGSSAGRGAASARGPEGSFPTASLGNWEWALRKDETGSAGPAGTAGTGAAASGWWTYRTGIPASWTDWERRKGVFSFWGGLPGLLVQGWQYIRFGDGFAWYHFSPDGWMDTGWYHGSDGWYYLEKEGPGIGTLHLGWLKDPADGCWYYLDPLQGGRMVTGRRFIEGKTWEFEPSGRLIGEVKK